MVIFLMIDIIEQEIIKLSPKLFNTLLMDHTTNKNICWATENYKHLGPEYYPQEPIKKSLITGPNTNVIQPRVEKELKAQIQRTKENAEVFTPSWICNEQNNLIDESWFSRKDVFNRPNNQGWNTVTDPIIFPEGKNWEDYIDSRRLEISCGEAPYLVSRYDTVTGKEISVENRIGLLDRKLRIVNENTSEENDWYYWTKRAFESTYGYEYQGDSLLIARENLLYTFIENMEYKFSHEPSEKQLQEIARIISWNIWQMDGITFSAPYSERPRVQSQLTIFDLMGEPESNETEPIPCKIFDWRSKKSLEFKTMIAGGNTNDK